MKIIYIHIHRFRSIAENLEQVIDFSLFVVETGVQQNSKWPVMIEMFQNGSQLTSFIYYVELEHGRA